MRRESQFLAALCVVATASAGVLADDSPIPRQAELQNHDVLSATPLLSENEQAEYRARIRAAADGPERERIRATHYELMKARARERGHTLPEIRPSAVGEAGRAFGPQVIDEDARAAQRATSRKAASPMVVRTIDATRVEQGTDPAVPRAKEQPVVTGTRPGEAKRNDVVEVTAPNAPTNKPAESVMGAVVLPGVETVFGPQLMSEDERAAFRTRLRSAKSDGERQAIRDERDAQMRSRAKEKGVTLPQ